MSPPRTFTTPDSLAENLPQALKDNEIQYTVTENVTFDENQNKCRVVDYECHDEGSFVSINILNRLDDTVSETMVMARLGFLCRRDERAEQAADRIVGILVRLGAKSR